MTPTPTDDSGVTAAGLPRGEDIYDALMGRIEPDLLTTNIPHLDEKYAGETTEEKAARYKRYEAAYAAYDAAFQQWIAELHVRAGGYRRDALRSAEQKDRQQEAAALSSLESQLS